MTAFTRTTVQSATEEAAEQIRIVLADPGNFVDAHERPGQYCHLRVPDGEPSFYALLSTPGERTLAFLVKAAGEPGAGIAALRAGDVIEASAPEGPGFDVDAAKGRDVVFVATGTGIAPIRAVIEVVLASRRAFGTLSLYYGVRDASFVAFASDISRWTDAGLDVRITHSRREDATAEGARGYVQELILKDRPDLGNAALFAAGQEELLEELARSVGSLGGTRDWILHNL